MIPLAASALVCALAAASCHPPAPPAPRPVPAAPARTPPQVLDAFGSGDRAWIYVDGRALREAVLPDLLQAASALRADVQVALAAASAQCGFQPLLSIDEALVRIRWADAGKPAWATVLRMQTPSEQTVRCLRAVVPEAQETSLDGRTAWQLPRALVVWSEGLFIVASSVEEARATVARIEQPDGASLPARSALAGVLLSASIVQPNPLGMTTLGVRWTAQPPGTRLELHARFLETASARRTESIFHDGLLEIMGASASLDPAAQGLAERFVQGAAVIRDGEKLDVNLDMPVLAGQTAFVSHLAAVTVRGVRQHTAWDLMGEARETVYAIARALSDYAVRVHGSGRPVRFPPSAPLVPDDIPYGKRVTPNPHAFLHPSWQDIRFSSDRPTYYACDFVTAKDARSVVVRARGDIDGDGTTSLFELDVRLDAHDAPVIAPLIRERDPEE